MTLWLWPEQLTGWKRHLVVRGRHRKSRFGGAPVWWVKFEVGDEEH